jgi:hypothetical protein
MTKSIIITYQEADESFLMTFFKRFGVKTNYVKNATNDALLAYVADISAEKNTEIRIKDLSGEQEEEAILPPRQYIDLSQLIGGFKNKMTIEEIESLTKSWRTEWEHDLS